MQWLLAVISLRIRKDASKQIKEQLQYTNKRGKPLPKYIMLQECFGFALSTENQEQLDFLGKKTYFQQRA